MGWDEFRSVGLDCPHSADVFEERETLEGLQRPHGIACEQGAGWSKVKLACPSIPSVFGLSATTMLSLHTQTKAIRDTTAGSACPVCPRRRNGARSIGAGLKNSNTTYALPLNNIRNIA